MFFEMRALLARVLGLDVLKDTQLARVTTPRDLAERLSRREADAVLAWQPLSDQLVVQAGGVYLVKQIDLWREAAGRSSGYPVHGCHVVSAALLHRHPAFARDLNEAQREAVEVFYGQPVRAVEILAEAAGLPREVAAYAHGQTVRMLHGLSDEQSEAYEGPVFLGADLWDAPVRVRQEFLWRP